MRIRSLALLSIVAASFSFAPSALADVPEGGPTTTGGGGSTAGTNTACTVAAQSIAGSTCMECDPTGSACTSLGSDYNFVCNASATSAVWCNGPARTTPSDSNVSCAVSVPGGAWSGLAAAGVFAMAAALGFWRRRKI